MVNLLLRFFVSGMLLAPTAVFAGFHFLFDNGFWFSYKVIHPFTYRALHLCKCFFNSHIFFLT